MSTTYARERTLQEEIAPAVEQRVPGVEVLAVELLSPSRFCVYVDHPERCRPRALRARHRASSTATAATTRSTSRPRARSARSASESTSRRSSVASVALRTTTRSQAGSASAAVVTEAGESAVTLEVGDVGVVRIPYDAIVRAI